MTFSVVGDERRGYSHKLVGPDVVGTVNLGTLLFTDPFRRRMSSLPLMGTGWGREAAYREPIP